MNSIGAYICNYNGKSWVHKCIESLSKQTKKDFDLYVVDNASTDGTVESVWDTYGDSVGILVNSENLGGAGGFDRGLRHGIQEGYKYIVLFDNDIELDIHFMENMYDFMEKNVDVGIAGSKVMIMDEPDSIQDFGCRLDYVKYKEFQQYPLMKDDDAIPEINECDYVPTCAVMVRVEALKNSGTMPVENFIYYDDIELSQKMVRNGYRVVALGNAKVWHKGGFRKGEVNTFPKYYFLRNRLHFFSKFVDDSDIDHFIDTLLEELFAQLFGYYIKNNKELFDTVNYAFHDYLSGKRGKASDSRIQPLLKKDIPFQAIVKDKEKICIEMLDNYDEERPLDIFYVLVYLIGFIQTRYPKEKIHISLERCTYSVEEFSDKLNTAINLAKPDYDFPSYRIVNCQDDNFDIILRLCKHVRSEEKYDSTRVYIDRYANCIGSESDYNMYKQYDFYAGFFKNRYRNIMKERVMEIRNTDT